MQFREVRAPSPALRPSVATRPRPRRALAPPPSPRVYFGLSAAGAEAPIASDAPPVARTPSSSTLRTPSNLSPAPTAFSSRPTQRYKEMPVELATSPLEVVINDVNDELAEEGETAASQWGKKEAAETEGSAPKGNKSDGKDWHAKPAAEKGGKGKGKGGRVDLTPLPEGTAGAEIVRAENAWARGGADDARTKTTRAIKGILNKITPEKFDRLMEQLLECGIDDADTLGETISIVFDKAIWEPGFCSMYADVCLRLSKELPEFPADDGGKPMTFRRILLNTCQEEFEGAGKAREELESIVDPAERAAATKRVKVRTMGNIKLIGELFKKKMIAEKILHACVTDLLGAPKSNPPEENVEALCNLLTTVGKEMDASPKLPKQMMDMYFARLDVLAESDSLDSRVRFLCRDVIELRRANWVPRVKKLEAMTLNEIHAEAAAALGISPAATEEILFPEGPGDGWEVVGKGGKSSSNNLVGMAGGKQSSLSGPYVAPTHKAAMPTEKEKAKRDAELRKAARDRAAAALLGPAVAAGASDGADAKPTGGSYDAEKVKEKTMSAVNEYMQVADLKEATLCAKEIVEKAKDAEAAGEMTKTMIAHVIDASSEKARDLIAKLLVACVKECGVDAATVASDLDEQIGALEDLAIDVPMAPKLLGVMVAQLIIEGVFEATYVASSAEKIDEGGMPTRRDYVAAVFKELKAKGKASAADYAKQGGVDVAALLTGDEKFDGPLAAFLEKNGLKELC